MSRPTAVGCLLITCLLAASVSSFFYFSKPTRPYVIAVPVQRIDLAQPSSEEVRRFGKTLSQVRRAIDSRDRQSASSKHRAIASLRTLIQSSPELVRDPDAGADTAALLSALYDANRSSQDAEIIADLCLDLRWTPIRLQGISSPCMQVLDEHNPSRRAVRSYELRAGISIVNPNDEMLEAINHLSSNPYRASSLYRLASLLVAQEEFSSAMRLRTELLQLDIELATELESKIAKASGLKHDSNVLPY